MKVKSRFFFIVRNLLFSSNYFVRAEEKVFNLQRKILYSKVSPEPNFSEAALDI